MFLLIVHYSNGGYMRKVFLVIIILVIIIISSVRSNYYLDYSDSYGLYSLSIEGLNTKNFLYYFSGVNVVGIYSYINPAYKKQIGDFFYRVESSDLSYEINSFRNQYLSLIKKNSYLDYNYLYLHDISISRVDVYMSGIDLYNFLNNIDLVFTVKKVTDCCI